MSKQIFLLYSCDAWKSTPMDLIWVGTSQQKLRKYIIHQIELGDMSYYDVILDTKMQISKFKTDWKKELRSTINDRLIYGFYDYCHDNEEV